MGGAAPGQRGGGLAVAFDPDLQRTERSEQQPYLHGGSDGSGTKGGRSHRTSALGWTISQQDGLNHLGLFEMRSLALPRAV